MPAILREVSVGAGAAEPNLLSGSAFEYVRSRSVLSMGLTAAATGSFVLINVGSDVVLEDTAPPVLTRYAIIPDEMYFQDVAEQGDRIVQAVRNPTGGAIVHRSVTIITPV